ncbi:MAG: 2OG-Fe(II) oxygenase [Myxococcota bacterium]
MRSAPRSAGLDRDWRRVEAELERRGYATLPGLLSGAECETMRKLWSQPQRFRKTVDMAHHRFGSGEYRYLARPLPRLVEQLRRGLYRRLAPIAGRWTKKTGDPQGYPATLREFLDRCSGAGQTLPTPLLLRYTAGDYNRLHRDLYGKVAFPLQAAVLLSRPGVDYEGGRFLLVEQHPRAQSIAHTPELGLGDGVIFATSERPVRGARATLRVGVRHGVSEVTRGERFVLGIILHDAH